MAGQGHLVPIFSPPDGDEARALELAAAYLRRAGNEASTRLMSAHHLGRDRFELLSTLRDELRDSAALCESLAVMFESWDWRPDRP